MTCVYVQTNLDGEWINENCYKAARGFYERGYEVLPFTSDELHDGKLQLSRDTIVCGGVHQVRSALESIGVRPPDLFDYPHCLRRKFLDLAPVEKTLAQVLSQVQEPDFSPVFIKPSRRHKAFTGLVVSEFSDLLKLNGVEPSTRVWTMKPTTFLSEYRIFMHKGEVVGMKHYKGDPFVLPEERRLRLLVKQAKAMAQVAYALDVGVANFPRRPEQIRNPTLLVEANDAHSLGAYGLPSWIYVQMIEDRWKQMTKK
jgi:hypothetical protein